MPTPMSETISDIVELLENNKSDILKEFYSDYKKNKIIQPVNNDEDEARERTGLRIKTGTIIDQMISGGIGVGESAMLYGAPASGKTQTVLTAVALCPNIVVYIDVEGSFSWVRMEEICAARGIDFAEKKKRIIMYRPKNWAEQLIISRSIPSPKEIDGKIDLIVCDSLIDDFRGIEFTGRQSLPLKTGFLREFIMALKDNAIAHQAAVLYTNQVSAAPAATAYSSPADIQQPCGGFSVTHKPTYSLFFRKGVGNIRYVRMMDSSNNALCERSFVINTKGIDDLPENARAAQNAEKITAKFDAKQSQETIISKSAKVKAVKTADEITEEELGENSDEEVVEEEV